MLKHLSENKSIEKEKKERITAACPNDLHLNFPANFLKTVISFQSRNKHWFSLVEAETNYCIFVLGLTKISWKQTSMQFPSEKKTL